MANIAERPERGSGEGPQFFESASRIMVLAQEEAGRFNHNYIGTEHILLGLLQVGSIKEQFEAWGVTVDKVRSAVEFVTGRGELPVLGEIGLTPRAKKVFEIAKREATRFQAEEITPIHLLAGLVLEGEGIGAGVLESLGVNRERVLGRLGDLRIQNSIPEALNRLKGALEDPGIERVTKDGIIAIINRVIDLAQRPRQ